MSNSKQCAEARRGTDAQILKERELTASAIQGAMAFGYQGGEYPPDDSAWLRPFYDLGVAAREREDALGLLTGLHPCLTIDGPPMEVAQRIFDAVLSHQRDLNDKIKSKEIALDNFRTMLARARQNGGPKI